MRYIYRKVKLIYKSIHYHKRKGKNKNKNKKEIRELIKIDEDILGKVEKDVSEWADLKTKEIDSLRSMEEYRRNLLGDISHELKTPIFNMQGYLFTLIEGGLYDEKINKDYLQRALANVGRLQAIVEDLDLISKLESDRIQLKLSTFDLKLLIDECIEDNAMLAKAKKINIRMKRGGDRHFFVKADRENIRHVLNNLINNSIKYGKEHGSTRIGCYNLESYILVEVSDNGTGISPEDLKHVFDRFYRADKSRSRKIEGSGLGLSIVKHIMEAHRQTISVTSEIDKGSTFSFTLEKA